MRGERDPNRLRNLTKYTVKTLSLRILGGPLKTDEEKVQNLKIYTQNIYLNLKTKVLLFRILYY